MCGFGDGVAVWAEDFWGGEGRKQWPDQVGRLRKKQGQINWKEGWKSWTRSQMGGKEMRTR